MLRFNSTNFFTTSTELFRITPSNTVFAEPVSMNSSLTVSGETEVESLVVNGNLTVQGETTLKSTIVDNVRINTIGALELYDGGTPSNRIDSRFASVQAGVPQAIVRSA